MPFTGRFYEPQTLTLMESALAAAWTEAEKKAEASSRNSAVLRTSMARRIMEAFDAGIVDLEALKRAALFEIQADKRH